MLPPRVSSTCSWHRYSQFDRSEKMSGSANFARASLRLETSPSIRGVENDDEVVGCHDEATPKNKAFVSQRPDL